MHTRPSLVLWGVGIGLMAPFFLFFFTFVWPAGCRSLEWFLLPVSGLILRHCSSSTKNVKIVSHLEIPPAAAVVVLPQPTPSATTQAPTPQPTPQPSTQQPMVASSAPVASTLEPSSSVTAEPTVEPTAELIAEPTEEPTEEPTAAESTTEEPTPSPTAGVDDWQGLVHSTPRR